MKKYLLTILVIIICSLSRVYATNTDQTSDYYFKNFLTPSENKFIKSASVNKNNDIAFYSLCKTFDKTIEEMNVKNVDEIWEWMSFDNDCDNRIIKIPQTYYAGHGIMIHQAEGGLDYQPDYLYLKNKYDKYISDEYKIWLDLQNEYNKNLFFELCANEKYNRIITLENFINKYPNFVAKKDVEKLLKQYVDIYIGSGSDASYNMFNDKGILKSEYKKSFKKFLKENKTSRYYDIVYLYYQQLMLNHFKRTEQFHNWRVEIFGTKYFGD